MRQPVGIHVIKFDDGRAGQQQGQNDLGGFLRGRRIAHLCVSPRPGEGADQLAQVGFAAAKDRRPHMERWRVWKRRPCNSGEDRSQCRGPVGVAHEMEFCKQPFEQDQCFARRLGRRVGEAEQLRVEHSEALRHHVVTGLHDQFAIALAKIRLPGHACQRRQMAKTLGIEQDGGVPRRRIAAVPLFGARDEAFPRRRGCEFSRQCRQTSRHHRWVASRRVGSDGNDQTAGLIVAPATG